MAQDEQDKKIVSFLEGKTIQCVVGQYCRGGLELVFTDGSKIEIDPVADCRSPLIEYTIDGEIV